MRRWGGGNQKQLGDLVNAKPEDHQHHHGQRPTLAATGHECASL